MKIFYLGIAFLLILSTPFYGFGFQKVTAADTLEVIRLNNRAYEARKAHADQTVVFGQKARDLSIDLKYKTGIAESWRMIGIGYSYQFNQPQAFDAYLNALSTYQDNKDSAGVAKVNMNIGNLYRDNDYDKALEYFNYALKTGLKIKDNKLIASLYLNMGNVYVRKKQFELALETFEKSRVMFEKLDKPAALSPSSPEHPNLKPSEQSNIISCYQNEGVAYFQLRQYDKAKEYLLKANESAKKLPDMNSAIASIDLTLADLSVAQNQFAEAEKYIAEGMSNANYPKVKADFHYTQYELEKKRKNYQKALTILTDIYTQDSLDYKTDAIDRTIILKKSFDKSMSLLKTENQIAEQRIKNYLFIGLAAGSSLLIVVIVLLVMNVKRKVKTNLRLTELNGEVSRQKDNLDRINHHLEEIIDERTKDLQIKNKKLSEYSSYLSHQIRGPIATLKGLMNLEKEGLVDKKECISMMNKCVSEIDDKIIDMSDMLHDPDRAGF